MELTVPYSDGATQAWLHANSSIIREEHGEGGVTFEVNVDPVAWAKFSRRH
jgi:GTP-binding protein HflX